MSRNAKAQTTAPVAPVVSNVVAFDVTAEHALIRAIRADFGAVIDKANMAAIGYVRFALSTRNCDLIRMLYDALPVKYQGAFTSWVKTCAPITKRTTKQADGSKSVSFGIDKNRIAEEGIQFDVLNAAALNAGPFGYVKPRVKKVQTLDALLESLNKALAKASSHAEAETIRAALTKAASAINEAGQIAAPHVFDASELPGQRLIAVKTNGNTSGNVHELPVQDN